MESDIDEIEAFYSNNEIVYKSCLFWMNFIALF